jgi:hypothetical protein
MILVLEEITKEAGKINLLKRRINLSAESLNRNTQVGINQVVIGSTGSSSIAGPCAVESRQGHGHCKGGQNMARPFRGGPINPDLKYSRQGEEG